MTTEMPSGDSLQGDLELERGSNCCYFMINVSLMLVNSGQFLCIDFFCRNHCPLCGSYVYFTIDLQCGSDAKLA